MEKRSIKISLLLFLIISLISLTGCYSKSVAASANGKIFAVGAENEYANVIQQIGGKYVTVIAIMSDPNTDPHEYEANTTDALNISKADLIVENGLGYDDFMDQLEASSPNSNRTVINVAKALGYSDNTENPHLWYDPNTMPKVAALIAKDFESKMPNQKQYFEDQLAKFDNSMEVWTNDLNQLKEAYANTAVAVTEPVPDYLLQAANLNIKTPWAFQAAVMNGIDPSPQDVKIQAEPV